jgi:pilus assembly protein CpaE
MANDTVSVLVALDSGVHEQHVRELLAETAGIELAGVVGGLQESWTAMAGRPTDAVLLVCAPGSEPALRFLTETARSYPDRPAVVLCGASANGFVRHAFDAGADDLVMLSEQPGADIASTARQLQFTLQKVVARRRGAVANGTALGSLVCVLGPKGGIGKTLTSANLSVALASEGHRVALVDLDLQFGDVGLSLGLSPQRTIYDLVRSGGSLDAEKVEAYLTPHESGARVLMAPTRPDHAGAVTVDFLRELYPLLRAGNDYVVVDTPPGFTPEVIATIDSSTHLCLVGMLDSLSLKNTKLGLETLALMGYDRSRICTVLNRADTNVGVTQDDVTAILGAPSDVLVPSSRDVVRSINAGTPMVLSHPRSETARAYRALAGHYAGTAPEARGRRLLRRRNG